MQNFSILYIFRRPVKHSLYLCQKNKNPHDIFYGLTKMRKLGASFSDNFYKHRFLLIIQDLLNKFFSIFYDSGFSLLGALFLIPTINKYKIVFTTVDTYGLPIALFKSLKLIKPKIIFNTIGLYDGLINRNNYLTFVIIKNILKNVDKILSGGSFYECKKLSKLLKIPINNFIFIPFGIDTEYFYPNYKLESNEILSIGADLSRDWKLFLRIIQEFPTEKFRIITQKGLINTLIPPNVICEYNLDFENVRNRIWRSKYVIILSKKNYHFAGQSTAMRCMSCAKPVIFTSTPGVEEYNFKNYENCINVKINAFNNIVKSIKYLNKSKVIRKRIGKNARKIIIDKYNIEIYSKRLENLFISIFNQK